MTKKRIAIDIDGVLIQDRSLPFLEFSILNGRQGDLECYLTTNCYEEATGMMSEEVSQMYHLFKDSNTYPLSQPIHGAVDALHALSKNYELHLVTSRDPRIRKETEQELAQHFPFSLFQDLHMGGWNRKHELIKNCGASVMIEDNYKLAVQMSGVTSVILFPQITNQRMKRHPELIYPSTHQTMEHTQAELWHPIWQQSWQEITELVPQLLA